MGFEILDTFFMLIKSVIGVDPESVDQCRNQKTDYAGNKCCDGLLFDMVNKVG